MKNNFEYAFNLWDMRVISIGNHALILENFKAVVKLTESEIWVTDGKKRLKIAGEKLLLKNLSKYDAYISGKVKTFEWIID